MTSWLWGSSQFDEEVDKATSELLPTDQEDIVLNLEICDQIKAKLVQPKDAMRALKRRLNHKNPNVQLLALTLTDICVKNGGNHFLAEISSREFMDNLVSILKIVALNNDVRSRILKLIQNWAVAFEGKPEFSYVTTVYRTLISEGYKFPPKDMAVANNAMTDTAIAPEWIDSDVCLRCRDPFTFTNRRHHCRNCGQVYDQKCSSKNLPLPHFGIIQEVRVCDACHFKLTRKKEAVAKEAEDAKRKALRQQIRHDNTDHDLARAIELSLRETQAGQNRAGYAPLNETPKQWITSEPPLIDRNQARQQVEEDDDLRAAIEASLREAHAPHPSAPIAEPETGGNRISESPVALIPSYELEPQESDAIMTFNQTVSDAQTYGLSDLRQTHELYTRASTLRPKLTRSLDDTERKEQLLSEMHDKLSQAVKLYDHLLTEQVSQSSRRQQAYSQPSYGQYLPQTQQHQWAPPSTATYGSPYATMQSPAPNSPTSVAEQRWAPTSVAYQPAAPSASRVIQTQYAPEHSVVSPPSMQPVTLPPSSVSPHVTQFQSQQYPAYAAPLPAVTLPSASSPYQHPAVASQPTATTQPPVTYAAQPTPTPTAHQQPSLSRHSTLQSYHTRNTSLQRSNTVASNATAQQSPYPTQQAHYQQQQRVPIASPPPSAPPVTLPVLPTAPTNAPSTYSLYAPNVPNTVPASEPKEAMLISFD